MKKVLKSKRAFTLLEVVMVVAIIVIVAGSVFISVSSIMNKAESAGDDIRSAANTNYDNFSHSEDSFRSLHF